MFIKTVLGRCISIRHRKEISNKKNIKSYKKMQPYTPIVQFIHFPYIISGITLYIIINCYFSSLKKALIYINVSIVLMKEIRKKMTSIIFFIFS